MYNIQKDYMIRILQNADFIFPLYRTLYRTLQLLVGLEKFKLLIKEHIYNNR